MSDKRARLGVPANGTREEILGKNEHSNLLQPLIPTNGILFPYTPDVLVNRNASYENFSFTHTNYSYYQFKNSAPDELQVNADFTVQTNGEGRYLLAVLHFLKSMTMIEYGLRTPSSRRGTPPPVLRFNYLGPHMFSNVPVVVNRISYNLQKDVDYTPVQLPEEISAERFLSGLDDTGFDLSGNNVVNLPTKLFVTISLLVQQNPRDVRENFNLSKFKNGQLLNRGYL